MLTTKKIPKIAISLLLILLSFLYSVPLFAESENIIDKDYRLTTKGKNFLTELFKTCEQPDGFATLQKFYNVVSDANLESVMSDITDIAFSADATDCWSRLSEGYMNYRIKTSNPNVNKCQCLDEHNNPHGSIEGSITVSGKRLNVDYNTCRQICCGLSGAPIDNPGAVSWIYNSEPQGFC